jgi:hypothetical protein
MTLSLVAGCSSPASDPVPTFTPASSPSQDELDASTFQALYATYIDLPFDEESEDDLRSVLTGSALSSDLQSLESDRQSGRQIVGKDTFRGFVVTDHGLDPASGEYMVAQVCLDVSGTRVLDAGGADVTPERDDLLNLQMKAVKVQDQGWRISDFVRNDSVHVCG